MMIRKSIIITIAVVIAAFVLGSMIGCHSAPEGYTVIRNRFRIFETPLSFPTDANVLRFAVAKRSRQTQVRVENIVVRKGRLTFSGSDGAISFTTNNSIVVSKNGQKDMTFPLFSQSVRFDLFEEHLMYVQGSIDPKSWTKWYEQKGNNVDNFSPALIAVLSNNYWLVDIPIMRSSDFDGDMGRVIINPNWY